MKLSSQYIPRLVVYISPAEMKAVKARAREAGLRTPNQWLGSILRVALSKPSK